MVTIFFLFLPGLLSQAVGLFWIMVVLPACRSLGSCGAKWLGLVS